MLRWRSWDWRKMRKRILLLLAVLCLLPGCRRDAPQPPEDPSAPPTATPAPPSSEDPSDLPAETRPIFLGRLTIEVAVDWSEADRILTELDELSRLAGEALAEKGCTVEDPVTVTIGTAGGITAQALSDGGVDAALLPAGDGQEIEASPVFRSSDGSITAAVTQAREELDENFRSIFISAFLDTGAGRDFLALCYPETAFTTLAP